MVWPTAAGGRRCRRGEALHGGAGRLTLDGDGAREVTEQLIRDAGIGQGRLTTATPPANRGSSPAAFHSIFMQRRYPSSKEHRTWR